MDQTNFRPSIKKPSGPSDHEKFIIDALICMCFSFGITVPVNRTYSRNRCMANLNEKIVQEKNTIRP